MVNSTTNALKVLAALTAADNNIEYDMYDTRRTFFTNRGQNCFVPIKTFLSQ